MAGSVNSSRVPYLPITVEIPEQGVRLTLDALVDTGFTSDIVVPVGAVPDSTPVPGYVTVRFADDSELAIPAYPGTVRIGETAVTPVTLLVLGSEAIGGLGVSARFRVIIDHDRMITFES
jgi:predicted aspartyl protease